MGTSNVAIVSFLVLASASTSSAIVDATRPFASTAFLPKTSSSAVSSTTRSILLVRGGEDATVDAPAEEKTLDEKVYAAMAKLGLSTPSNDGDDTVSEMDCKDGVCTIPGTKTTSGDQQTTNNDPHEMADRISKDMDVDSYMAMAALGATSTLGDANVRMFDESAARSMLQQELDLIANIHEDSESVKTLVAEGFDSFMARRALVFSENKLEDARAILLAEKLDAEEEEEEAARAAAASDVPPVEPSFQPMAPITAMAPSEAPTESRSDFVEVKTNFDPTKLPTSTPTPVPPAAPTTGNNEMPKPARREDVIFDATTDQIQELVLESKVPVLVDFYADWCGPCKALGPALEDMAIKAGGMFRLVKINSDNERPLSQAMEVSALPTVFGVSEGKIIHMFQGMPKSEEMMRNFMMGMFGAAQFNPSITAEQSEKYAELTKKLIKTASAASYSFSMRERLTDLVTTKMDVIVKDDSVADVEGSATLIRTFLSNIINDPYEVKFRRINLENKIVASKIGGNRSCLNVFRSIGFMKSGTEMVFKPDQKVINVAPLVVARDTVDKWIQRNRKEMAAAARKRQDELDRSNLVFEEVEEEVENEEVEEIDPTACRLKLRLDGKNKIYDATLHQDDPLKKVLDELNVDMGEDEIQITCVAKRLVVKSDDKEAMEKTLGEHGLMPAANIVVKVGASTKADPSNIKERVAGRKVKKTGSHTMQSIGVYAKDDNNKAELIDGGGGVWYEHDISDDEDEAEGEGEDNKNDKADTEESATKGSTEEENVEAEESATAESK